jgi:hypothetical protein
LGRHENALSCLPSVLRVRFHGARDRDRLHDQLELSGMAMTARSSSSWPGRP